MKTISNNTTHTSASYITLAVTLLLAFSAIGIANAEVLTRQLQQGMSGADVTALQTYLAKDATIYPQGLVTGYYGTLTAAAVSNFQARYGIATVGRVGPITLAAINQRMGGADVATGDVNAPVISNVLVSVGPNTSISWKTNENAIGKIYYDVTPLGMAGDTGAVPATVSVTGTKVESVTPGFAATHSVQFANLAANTTYHYVIHVTDQAGNESVTWPSTFRTN